MNNIIKFNGKLYQALEHGAYTIQGKIIEVSESPKKNSGRMCNCIECVGDQDERDVPDYEPLPKKDSGKCEHDKGTIWEEVDVDGRTYVSVTKADYPKCPICKSSPAPQDERKTPEEIAEEIVNGHYVCYCHEKMTTHPLEHFIASAIRSERSSPYLEALEKVAECVTRYLHENEKFRMYLKNKEYDRKEMDFTGIKESEVKLQESLDALTELRKGKL